MAENQRSRSSHVGVFLAAAALPRTFQRSLLPRDTIDQGAISGLVMAMVYALGVVMQDGVDLTAGALASSKEQEDIEKTQGKYSFLLSLAAIGTGLALQTAFKQKEDEKLERASVRTAGYWLSAVGLAGATIGLVEKVPTILSDKNEPNKELPLIAVPLIGAFIAIASEIAKPNIVEREELAKEDIAVKRLRSIGIGLGVATVVGVLTYVEEKVAHQIDNFTAKNLPLVKRTWLPIGHVFALGSLVGGVVWLLRKTYRKIENGAGALETAISELPESPLVSGSSESIVPWETLSVQGRRHIADQRTPADITEVMGEWAQTPIRIYSGFDSANTESARVELALAELKRTKAYDREYLVVISPTGTGYVNYIFTESVEYLTRGNCAMVTIQYSKRPSPLSLDQVSEGRHHYRMLLNGIRKELKNRPVDQRPKIILFGESLGAWTSQDSFIYEGTDGFEALGINGALWIGTPAMCKWKEQVLYDNKLNTNKEEIGVFNDFGQYQAMPNDAQESLKYFMITHYNDPVAHFNTSLLIQSPKWLASDRSKRPTTVPNTTRWRPVTTFVQTLVDMKNALKPIPGQFVATGHDYRGDLANFVQAVLGTPTTDQQMANVETALRRNEKEQAELLATISHKEK